jgi:hypothetical protein
VDTHCIKRWLPLVVAMFAYPLVVSAIPNAPVVVITNNHEYERGSLPRKSDWLGLYCSKSDCEVRNANVSVIASQTSEENVLGEKENIDVLSIEDSPIALFLGVTLKAGPATTWFRSEISQESAHYQKLHLLNQWHMPYGSRPLTLLKELKTVSGTTPNGHYQHKYYEYNLSDGVRKQLLFEDGLETNQGGEQPSPIVSWVGDLNGDGKIDLLISLPGEGSCGFDERLYLSSAGGDGVFVIKAAHFSGQIPVCGC